MHLQPLAEIASEIYFMPMCAQRSLAFQKNGPDLHRYALQALDAPRIGSLSFVGRFWSAFWKTANSASTQQVTSLAPAASRSLFMPAQTRVELRAFE